MAATIGAALAQVASPEFDTAVGFIVRPRRAAPTDPDIADAFSAIGSDELRRLARSVASRQCCHPTEADDAVQDGLLELWSTRPELLRQPAGSWLGLLHEVARQRLQEARTSVRAVSTDALLGAEGSGALAEAEPCLVAASAANEASRYLKPPARGEPWSREQILGAIQRFRDFHGHPPKAVDFRSINALPSISALRRHFPTLADALLAAGMVPESGIFRRRTWSPVAAARACRAFRRRNARWPNWRDVKRCPGELPSTSVMIRCFGGTRSIDVQLGAEAILDAVGEPTA